jgi:hypothetical protein
MNDQTVIALIGIQKRTKELARPTTNQHAQRQAPEATTQPTKRGSFLKALRGAKNKGSANKATTKGPKKKDNLS